MEDGSKGEERMAGYIVAIIAAVFGSTGFWSWLSGRRRKKDGATKLILGLAYQQIIRSSEHYIARGYIDIDEFTELNKYLFEPYTELGGNGTAAKLMSEVRNLPTRPKEDKA